MFSGPESTASTVPAFVAKLWQMVCDPSYDDLISWCHDGTSFVIKDQTKFCSELLPMYYKHNNMASFIRQLNKYGFRKVVSVNSSLKNDISDFEFCHPLFLKDCPVLLNQIKRKVSISRDMSELKNDQNILAKVLLEVQQLQQKQALFESRITSMKAENDALWREHSILRQKHQKQQKIVNRLIQFLVTLVHQSRNVNVKRRNMPLMLKDGTRLSIEGLGPIKERQYRPASPIICEIDPVNIVSRPKTSGTNNNSNVEVIIPDIIDEDSLEDMDLPSSDNLFLEVPSSSTVAVPLQEVSPQIILGQHTLNNKIDVRQSVLNNNDKSKAQVKIPAAKQRVDLTNKPLVKIVKTFPKNNINDVRTNDLKVPVSSIIQQAGIQKPDLKTTNKNIGSSGLINGKAISKSNVKTGRKRPLKTNQTSKRTTTPNFTSLNKNLSYNTILNNVSPLTADSNLTADNVLDDEINYTAGENSSLSADDIISTPIIQSPSGTQICLPDTVEDGDKEGNKNNSLVLSEPNLSKEDVETQIDMIQSDLDVLKELLHSEGLSLDASTIMGLFGNEDLVSMNMPEAGRSGDNTTPVGNELVSYNTPNLIDIVDGLEEDDIPTTTDPLLIDDISVLNTPQATYTYDAVSPSPSKRLKK